MCINHNSCYTILRWIKHQYTLFYAVFIKLIFMGLRIKLNNSYFISSLKTHEWALLLFLTSSTTALIVLHYTLRCNNRFVCGNIFIFSFIHSSIHSFGLGKTVMRCGNVETGRSHRHRSCTSLLRPPNTPTHVTSSSMNHALA